jgi:hypothetical protein
VEGWYTSLVLDSKDKSHISFYDRTNKNLKYITNASGQWVESTIDAQQNTGKYNSMAVDENDKLHISYYDEQNKDLKYATNASGTFQTQTLVSQKDVGEYTSLVVDKKRQLIHIIYYNATDTNISYVAVCY